jgi:ankyrin repeat protein
MKFKTTDPFSTLLVTLDIWKVTKFLHLIKAVKYLIENGTNIEICSKDLIKPIHLACREGNLEIVKYLTLKGTNLNDQDMDGYSCLHYASYNKHPDVVKFLILQKIDVNLVDNQV